MRKFFPVEDLARDERFHQVTMRDRMADPRTAPARYDTQIGETGLKPESDEYTAAFDAEMARQRQRVMSRLFVEVPQRRHVCSMPGRTRRPRRPGPIATPSGQ